MMPSMLSSEQSCDAHLEPEAQLSSAQQRKAAVMGVLPPADGVLKLAFMPQPLHACDSLCLGYYKTAFPPRLCITKCLVHPVSIRA